MNEIIPVFIVGMPRSGTTLISNMLNASGELYFDVETHVFEVYSKWKRKRIPYSFIDFYFNMYANTNPNFQYLNLEKLEIERLIIECKKSDSIDKTIELICSFGSKKKGIQRWGEKTPGHCIYINKIIKIFPSAKIINIVRDPRDVYYSQCNLIWGKKNPVSFCKLYRRNYAVLEKHSANFYYKSFKYEELLENPEETLKAICDFAKISYSNDLIIKFQDSKNLNFDLVKEPWKINNKGKLDSSNAYKWKRPGASMVLNWFISWFLSSEVIKLMYEYSNNNSAFLNFVLLFKFELMRIFKKISSKINKI